MRLPDQIGFAQLRPGVVIKYQDPRYFSLVKAERRVGDGLFCRRCYGLIGRNMLAIQFVNLCWGSDGRHYLLCAHHVFNNARVASLAAAVPSTRRWYFGRLSLKDGPIVFFLAFDSSNPEAQ